MPRQCSFSTEFPHSWYEWLGTWTSCDAPYRWIKLCTGFAKQHQDPDHHSGAILRPKTRRTIQRCFGRLNTWETFSTFLVPGGRYLVGYSNQEIFVWDLGYTLHANCKLLASAGPQGETLLRMTSNMRIWRWYFSYFLWAIYIGSRPIVSNWYIQ